MFIETVKNIAVNTDHLVKIWTVKESGKSSVPDQFVIMGQTIHGEVVFIQGFGTPNEANEFKAQVFEIRPSKQNEVSNVPVSSFHADLIPENVVAMLKTLQEIEKENPTVYRAGMDLLEKENVKEVEINTSPAPKDQTAEKLEPKAALKNKSGK
jgi:hypothetical protein